MPISYNPETRIFKLDTENSTYALQINQWGYLVHLYYGKKLPTDQGLERLSFRGVFECQFTHSP